MRKNNRLLSFLLVPFICLSLNPRPAHAIASSWDSVNTNGVVLGYTLFGASIAGGTTAIVLACKSGNHKKCIWTSIIAVPVALVGMFVGLVIVDDNQTDLPVELKPIADQEAHVIGLTAEQQASYNSDLVEIGLIEQTLTQEITQKFSHAELATDRVRTYALDQWNIYKSSLSEPTQAALEKVRGHFQGPSGGN